jgi:hypothetical protein
MEKIQFTQFLVVCVPCGLEISLSGPQQLAGFPSASEEFLMN